MQEELATLSSPIAGAKAVTDFKTFLDIAGKIVKEKPDFLDHHDTKAVAIHLHQTYLDETKRETVDGLVKNGMDFINTQILSQTRFEGDEVVNTEPGKIEPVVTPPVTQQ